MTSINLHGTAQHGEPREFGVDGRAVSRDQAAGDYVYDRIRITVDGCEVNMFLDRGQVEGLHTGIGAFLADNPLKNNVGRMGKAITCEEIVVPEHPCVVPVGTDCMVLEHTYTKWTEDAPGKLPVHDVNIKLVVDFEEREIQVPIEQITYV